MDFNDVTNIFKEDLLRLERSIQENYRSDVPLIPGIGDYLLKNGGKRIRPLLLMVGTKLCGRDLDEESFGMAASLSISILRHYSMMMS